MIKRRQIEFLTKRMKEFPAVTLLGARQCGKTTLAKEFAKTSTKKTHYFDLESPADKRKLRDPQLLFEQLKNDLIILDEVQRMPEIFELLRHLIDHKKVKGRFLILGSASPELVKGVSETLAGRVAYINISPFHITEVSDRKNFFSKQLFRGGFPDSFLARTNEAQYYWMDNFIRTFVERDLNQLFGVSFSTQVMMRLWRMLAHHHGGIWNASHFSQSMDVSTTTLNKYLDYLEGSFMVRKLQPYFFNTKKRLVKAPKIYIRDIGITNYLLDIPSYKTMLTHPALGQLWEGYVIEQILAILPRTIQAYYYRTQQGAEMDLVLVKGVKPIMSVEIKYSSAPNTTRSMHESIEALGTTKNYIVVPMENDYPLGKNYQVCDLLTFLSKYLPK